MKIQFKFFGLLLCVAATSCSPASYFQIHRVDSPNADEISESQVKFEHDGFSVYYDFWSEYGNAGFVIHNQSDDNLYIDLSESFLIQNGYAFDYFKNREYRSESSTSVNYRKNFDVDTRQIGNVRLNSLNSGTAVKKSSTLVRKEKDVIVIPPQSKKLFSEYAVVSSYVQDCNLPYVPSSKKSEPAVYDYDTTPLKFSNVISYSFEKSLSNTKVVENKFYISQINNYRSNQIKGWIDNTECEGDVKKQKFAFKITPANTFFIPYY